MPDLPLTGGCNCGAVRFELTEPPVSASYCHCRRCQRRSGAAASPNARIVPGSLQLVSGADALGSWDPPDGWSKLFCSKCGSSLFSRDREDTTRMGVRMGAFDSDPGVEFTHRQFLESGAPWEAVPEDGLERFAGPPG